MATLSPSYHLLLWTNAAFDDADNPSRTPLHPINTNSPTNRDPRSPAFKKPSKMPSIDDEIDESEREIRRLLARVELLRTKKAELVTPAKFLEPKKAYRVVPAKFLEPKKGLLTPDAKKVVGLAKNLDGSAAIKKVQQSPASRRRGLSLGPMDIQKLRIPKLGGIQEEKVGNADERDFLEPKKGLLMTDAKRVGNLAKNLDGSAAIKKIEESPASRRRGSSLVQVEIQNPGIPKLGGIQEENAGNADESGWSLSAKSRPSVTEAPEKLKKSTAGPALKKIEESPVSPGPTEIQSGRLAAVDRTPVRTVQRSRMSLRAIQEEKVSNAEQRGLCLRAKSGPSIARAPEKSKTLALKMIEESPATARIRGRRLSLGPAEIQSTKISKQKVGNAGERILCLSAKPRSSISESPDGLKKVVVLSPAYTASARILQRSLSLWPSKIASAGFRTRSKTQEFKGEEEKNGRSSSASLKSRATAKFSDLRKGIGTAGANKSIEVEVPSKLLTPKVLFPEVRSSLPSKLRSKGVKARVVASRYSLATTGSSRRKWSSPEPGKLAITCRADDKLSLALGESSANGGSVRSPVWIELPKIKATGRMKEESPPNSGCVKRARDLIGRKSYFDHKALSFDDEESQ